MKTENAPETPATRFLRQQRIAHSTHLYTYEPHGGTRVSARELNVGVLTALIGAPFFLWLVVRSRREAM